MWSAIQIESSDVSHDQPFNISVILKDGGGGRVLQTLCINYFLSTTQVLTFWVGLGLVSGVHLKGHCFG